MIEWPESLTFGDIERIRKGADIDLLRVIEPSDEEGAGGFLSVWADVVGNLGITVNVLRLWLKISDDDWFGEGGEWPSRFDGESIKAGVEALEAALDDFFTVTGHGKTFGILARKARLSGETVTEILSQQLERKLDASLAEISGSNSGDLLESLASLGPIRTRSGRSTSSPGAPSEPSPTD